LEAFVNKIYIIFDKLESERLNFSEFIVAMDVIDNKENKENLKHIFKMFDADNNEKLDRKEMAMFVSYLAKFATFQDEKSSIEFSEKMIEDLDVNKDGEINEAEFIQVVVKNEKLLSLLLKALLS
jgi:Ca2+-binding EF-hand superfamily protein